LAEIALDPVSSPRGATAAARAILAASTINLESVVATIKADEHENLSRRVDELESQVTSGQGRFP
jgi:hypothetical protein